MSSVSGYILAGGQSRRMGRNKALIEIGGEAIVSRVIAAAAPVVESLTIVANDPDTWSRFGLAVIPDHWPGAAALGGIGTALRHATRPRALVLACDLPAIELGFLRFLLDLDPESDVTVPVTTARGAHPLCAVYSTRCLPFIAERIAGDSLKVVGFYDAVRVRRVEPDELEAAGFPPRLLENLNTPEDLARFVSGHPRD